ncbi:MAG TPA: hypothetical protein VFL34_13065 [Candidatus Sulfotelmatobacter sp.]|nr:hypothetical protein [Candidatus Sulfotelmatobacter sp.]
MAGQGIRRREVLRVSKAAASAAQTSLLEPPGFKNKSRAGDGTGRHFLRMMSEYTVSGLY